MYIIYLTDFYGSMDKKYIYQDFGVTYSLTPYDVTSWLTFVNLYVLLCIWVAADREERDGWCFFSACGYNFVIFWAHHPHIAACNNLTGVLRLVCPWHAAYNQHNSLIKCTVTTPLIYSCISHRVCGQVCAWVCEKDNDWRGGKWEKKLETQTKRKREE